MSKEAWFETWFDTNYYHLLYQHRDESEARQFIDALLLFLAPPADSSFLDVACGKGRHAISLNEKGYEVCGIDLSENSITEANKSSNDDLSFYVRDIRNPIELGPFDYALNLFTSFGYFDTREEHVHALRNIHACLKPGGTFVIDYLHAEAIINNLASHEVREIEGVKFEMHRTSEPPFIYKRIKVKEGAREMEFKERVMAFHHDELIHMLEEAGFTCSHTFGDYQLNPINDHSSRVIIIAHR